ncbi:hypothetical protein PoB_001146700 [Plakobranchus ocellatus]|uniref:Uncharacterized protein n=1 Tax=Plakobranchus ocellatus TaxID=259542 RepID=A0AAV3YPQ9_9GAST|nr:hypothetical protein PoB_001146700 [Plakobranchus ocellatus]
MFCPVPAVLRKNYTLPHAYLEGVVDERDPGTRCEVKLLIRLSGTTGSTTPYRLPVRSYGRPKQSRSTILTGQRGEET